MISQVLMTTLSAWFQQTNPTPNTGQLWSTTSTTVFAYPTGPGTLSAQTNLNRVDFDDVTDAHNEAYDIADAWIASYRTGSGPWGTGSVTVDSQILASTSNVRWVTFNLGVAALTLNSTSQAESVCTVFLES